MQKAVTTKAQMKPGGVLRSLVAVAGPSDRCPTNPAALSHAVNVANRIAPRPIIN